MVVVWWWCGGGRERREGKGGADVVVQAVKVGPATRFLQPSRGGTWEGQLVCHADSANPDSEDLPRHSLFHSTSRGCSRTGPGTGPLGPHESFPASRCLFLARPLSRPQVHEPGQDLNQAHHEQGPPLTMLANGCKREGQGRESCASRRKCSLGEVPRLHPWVHPTTSKRAFNTVGYLCS